MIMDSEITILNVHMRSGKAKNNHETKEAIK